jgi:hypothetical protein
MRSLLRTVFACLNEAVGWLLGAMLILAVGGRLAVAGIAVMVGFGIWGVIPGLLLLSFGLEVLSIITEELKTIP